MSDGDSTWEESAADSEPEGELEEVSPHLKPTSEEPFAIHGAIQYFQGPIPPPNVLRGLR